MFQKWKNQARQMKNKVSLNLFLISILIGSCNVTNNTFQAQKPLKCEYHLFSFEKTNNNMFERHFEYSVKISNDTMVVKEEFFTGFIKKKRELAVYENRNDTFTFRKNQINHIRFGKEDLFLKLSTFKSKDTFINIKRLIYNKEDEDWQYIMEIWIPDSILNTKYSNAYRFKLYETTFFLSSDELYEIRVNNKTKKEIFYSRTDIESVFGIIRGTITFHPALGIINERMLYHCWGGGNCEVSYNYEITDSLCFEKFNNWLH